MKEDAIHMGIAYYLEVVLTPDTIWFHVPNGIRTSRKQAGRHKAMGMKAGVSDLIFCHDGRHYEIELKAPGKYMRPTQKGWRDRLVRAGGKHAVCRSIDEVRSTLLEWGIPTRDAYLHKEPANESKSITNH